jgi:hypothetical protein
VINNPEEFRVRKQVLRDREQRAEWVALPNPERRSVACLLGTAGLSQPAFNSMAHLDADLF